MKKKIPKHVVLGVFPQDDWEEWGLKLRNMIDKPHRTDKIFINGSSNLFMCRLTLQSIMEHSEYIIKEGGIFSLLL